MPCGKFTALIVQAGVSVSGVSVRKPEQLGPEELADKKTADAGSSTAAALFGERNAAQRHRVAGAHRVGDERGAPRPVRRKVALRVA